MNNTTPTKLASDHVWRVTATGIDEEYQSYEQAENFKDLLIRTRGMYDVDITATHHPRSLLTTRYGSYPLTYTFDVLDNLF